MPLYDFECEDCGKWDEHYATSDDNTVVCNGCGADAHKRLTTGAPKRCDAPWIEECANGAMNDLTRVRQGKEENITTREQARDRIRHMYREPYPKAMNDNEVAANKRVGLLRTRYLERY